MVEFGLYNVADSPNLTFIFFIGLVLLTVLGFRFALYAHRNRVRTDIDAQRPIWNHMLYVGLLATLYGLLGILDVVSTLDLAFKSGVMLAVTLALAFAIRQVHAAASSATGNAFPFERLARAAFVVIVFVDVWLVALDGQSEVTAVIQGLGALAFVGYGAVFYRAQTTSARLRGTMIDSLLRHLLPVLTFASLVSIVSLAVPVGLDRIVVLHVQVVFIIMTATALMTATIKLQQNLAGSTPVRR